MNKQDDNKIAEPQLVRWGPVDNKDPGITAENEDGSEFIEWEDLKQEIEKKLLPQVRVVPTGSTVEIEDLKDRKNWIVKVLGPDNTEIAHVWLGPDGDNKWAWDGLVRVGNVKRKTKDGLVVWQTFERFSDGSYRRTEARIMEKEDLEENLEDE